MPSIWQEYDEVQLQLELEEEGEDHEVDREDFENTYYAVVGKMTSIIEKDQEAQSSHSQESLSRHSSGRDNQQKVKLPTIKLPSFSGKVIEFKHFYDTFNSLVIENNSVDDIQRYHYLLSALTGEAHQLIENLPITSENFKVAWEIICKRYYNLKLIATAHMKSLFSLPSMKRESVNELRMVLNQLVSNYNAIEALKLDTPLHEVLLSQLLLEKIDEQTCKEWEVKANNQQFPRLDELIEFLEAKCQALEVVKSNQTQKEKSTTSKQSESCKRVQSTSHSYVTRNHKCPVRQYDHAIYKCPTFTQQSVPQRKELVKNKGLCFNCLHPNHRIKECRAGRCHICKQKHHTLLHIEFKKNLYSRQKQCSA
ncbi:uncharacterized protein LOC124169753 isoform X1 [Ischnura elegans]|uniref:uncharacterized protein LOC124169753 isoform X1 n=1 Tax=Ischnura elegans TaxID=197161 RepID=UPI001ED891E1|nr:uncharacterized protein LOC124169753 isoform X1 [Ischnura elegans]XP_046404410.1 uncharacterized protein LOC124169753 isoform X1 [Ischnura elegans]